MSETNRQWLLRSRPVGMVKESNFELHSAPIPKPGQGQILVRIDHGELLLCQPVAIELVSSAGGLDRTRR